MLMADPASARARENVTDHSSAETYPEVPVCVPRTWKKTLPIPAIPTALANCCEVIRTPAAAPP